MLSETNTIIDVKDKLQNDFTFFGFTEEEDFTAGLTSISEDVERIYVVPRITRTTYDKIEEKDKEGLTPWEESVYWAEIFTICVEFLRSRAAIRMQLQNYSKEVLRVEGYTHQISAGGGSSGGDLSLKYFKEKMYMYWKNAGYDVMALSRTCTIFGDSPPYLAEDM